MKSFMILGALVGFLVGAGISLATKAPLPVALTRASFGALGMALLFRWWSQRWIASLQQAMEEQARRKVPSDNTAKTKASA